MHSQYDHAHRPHEPGWPLLQLPETAQQAVVAHLEYTDKHSLRQACAATAKLVDECARQRWICLDSVSYAWTQCSLQRRLPQLADLTVSVTKHCYSSERTSDTAMNQRAISLLEGGGTWSSITELSIRDLPEQAALLVMAACLDVQSFTLEVTEKEGPSPYTSIFQAAAASWPKLTTYKSDGVHSTRRLCDADMCALAACTALAELEVEVGHLSAAGWAALAGMQLTSLELRHDHLFESMAVDLRGLKELTNLNLGGPPEYDHAKLYETLHLPSTLVELTCQHLPTPAFNLPLLAHLYLEWHTLTDHDISRLAAGAPSLEQLHLTDLHLTEAANATPLASLQRLDVRHSCHIEAGTRLASVFPRLKDACLRAQGGIGDGTSFFEGASSLRRLDVGSGASACSSGYGWRAPGLYLDPGAFVSLGRARSLTWLRLRADTRHVVGLKQLRTLQEVEWGFEAPRASALDDLDFSAARAPAQLRSAKMDFSCLPRYNWPEQQLPKLQMAQAAARVAGDSVMWLVHAPALSTVCWRRDDGAFAALDRARLCALAANASIRRVDMMVAGCEESLAALAASFASEVRMLGRRRVRVQFEKDWRSDHNHLDRTWPADVDED